MVNEMFVRGVKPQFLVLKYNVFTIVITWLMINHNMLTH
jgi:hypothetical protein